jgi:hypothetical protein
MQAKETAGSYCSGWILTIEIFGGKQMELVKRLRGSIADQIELENTIARAKQLEARLEYVAMMADVDIDPEEDPEEEDE